MDKQVLLINDLAAMESVALSLPHLVLSHMGYNLYNLPIYAGIQQYGLW